MQIAVCAPAPLSATTGALQYRFGTPERIELAHPAAGAADWRASTGSGTLMLSGGVAFIAFARPPYRSVVYSAVGRGWSSEAGVVERSRHRIVASRRTVDAFSEVDPALFSAAGIEPIDGEFELP